MIDLVCRRCDGEGEVEKVLKYPHVNIVSIVCKRCKNRWYKAIEPSNEKEQSEEKID